VSQYVFGVDIGGTTIKFGLFQVDGKLVEKFVIGTNTSDDGRHLLPDVAKAILKKLETHGLTLCDVKGIGVGVPSPVDDEGMALMGTNVNWKQPVPVKEALAELLKVSIYTTNDANLAALGELSLGAAKGKKSAILLTLGTGIGGGIVVDGKVINGFHGVGGEIGHLVAVAQGGAPCGCGKIGCLETVASATGIVRLAKEQFSSFKGKSLLGDLDNVRVKHVFDAAKAGDEFSLEIIDEVGHHLGLACANLAATMDPELFIIGGGVSHAGTILLDAIVKHYQIYAIPRIKNTPFELATLGNEAGIIGGAYLAVNGD